MAVDVLKFRCYRCNQLLAVAPNKAGAIVSCPKCKSDLQVPGGDSPPRAATETRPKRQAQAPQQREGAGPGPTGSPSRQGQSAPASPPLPVFLEGIVEAIPPEVAELRPEDLRVEAEFFSKLTRPPEPAPDVEPTVDSAPTPDWASASAPASTTPLVDLPSRELSKLLATAASVAPVLAPADLVPPVSETPPAPTPVQESPVVPPIEVEAPSIRPPGPEVVTTREVVLPASVVLAWSLFVLLGIAASFVAGLLIGHYLWRIH
jgi:phage FluMu protein Com